MDALKTYSDSDDCDDFLLETKKEIDPKENGYSVNRDYFDLKLNYGENETIVKTEVDEDARSDNCDYFGLKFNDCESESLLKTELDDIRLSTRLEEQSVLLHESNYGPNYLQPFETSRNKSNTKSTISSRDIPPKRMCKCWETNRSASQTYHVRLQDCYKFKAKSESANLFELNETQKNDLCFVPHEQITQQISNKTYSKLPSHIINKLDVHGSSISKVCWSSPQYSHLLLSSSLDSTLKIYNLFTTKCERQLKVHRKGVRAAVWTLCGRKVFSGGYDGKALLTDTVTGNVINTYSHNDFVTSVQKHPEYENILLSGTKNHVMTWDSRLPDHCIRKFSSHCGHVLDIAFLSAGKEVIFSSDIVSKDSADRTIIAWDFETGALLSNQIYQERYTCPCLKVEPGEANFIAQTNGSYIAVFSSCRPYKMNKNKRYEGHKVAGYNIDCNFSPDGKYVITGDADGDIYIYETKNAKLVRKLSTLIDAPTSTVSWHPVLPSTIAVGTVTGSLQIWE